VICELLLITHNCSVQANAARSCSVARQLTKESCGEMESFDPDRHIEISRIGVKGNERTRESYFQNELSGAIHCQNISELHQYLLSATGHLKDTGLFDGVEANIRICDAPAKGLTDASKISKFQRNGGSPYNIAVDITVKEVGVPQLKLESYIQTGRWQQAPDLI
jgi:hypothetical protein